MNKSGTLANVDPQMNEDALWEAVILSDPRADGKFVYAVDSTGIYCRPSCPSRKPLREVVSFFENPQAAEEAGYRACKRCKPRETPRRLQITHDACVYIDAHLDETPTLMDLGEHLDVSPYHLQRVFKSVIGISPKEYAEAQRVKQVKQHLRERPDVTSSIYEAGYGSSSRLYEHAPERLGMTPATYKKGGAGMSINYTIVDSSLGRLLIGATEQGVCAVELGSDDAALIGALEIEYPAAEISDSPTLTPWIETIMAAVEAGQPAQELPLDLRTTAFRWQVWRELQRIPTGATRSYAEIARSIGKPQAVRAVANACAANPAAIVIPCHRVIRSDGSIGGYRWGSERKEILLERERNVVSA